MPEATLVQSSFLGGIWSETAQGRVDIPQYRTAMNVCFNSFPTVTGSWTTRSGTLGTDPTRLGLPGRVVKFDAEQATPYVLEFTDNWLRFRSPYVLSTTNDGVNVISISAATPAVVNTASAVTWATGNAVFFTGLGSTAPSLQNRRFLITVTDGTHFSLADEVTGVALDGSALGFMGGTINRVQEVATPYAVASWASVRVIQAEDTAVLVGGMLPVQFMQATFPPNTTQYASFTLDEAVFLDGPYLDAFTNGVRVTPGGLTGIITLTLSFQDYDSATAYAKGAFVADSGVNYVSLQNTNVGNTPATSPTFWNPTVAGAAINDGQGWLGTDIGRMVRIYSEPTVWDKTVTYAAGDIVTYNPTKLPGANQYWTSLTGSNTGFIPGNDATHWEIATNAELWSWGKIVSIGSLIDGNVSGVAHIGDMTTGGSGSLASLYDGVTSKSISLSAAKSYPHGSPTKEAFAGQHYAGGAQMIANVTVFPTSDQGLVWLQGQNVITLTLNLRAKQTAPSSGADGTLLGTVTLTADQTSAITIMSNDQVTAWNYVWVELTGTFFGNSAPDLPPAFLSYAQLQFFAPTGTGTGATADMEILGPALLYTVPVVTWRLGVFTGTTQPSCGTYHEGRLWLGGAVSNRFDAGVAGDPNIFNFAPTLPDGTVTAASGISYTLLGPSVNPMYWMHPEQQGIICGTKAGEWLVFATTQNQPLSVLNIQAHQVTAIGSYNAEPKRTEHTLVFIQRYQRRLMEYFADVYSGKFSAPDLSEFSKHLTRQNLVELAYQQDITPTIWERNTDGTFTGTTYKRDSLSSSQGPTYAGWHVHALGSGRTLTSITVGPSASGSLDALFMVTVDPVTKVNYVEQMQEQFNENVDDIRLGWFLDSATPAASYTILNQAMVATGFWYLAGKEVRVTAGGVDLGLTAVRKDGTISIPLASDATKLFTADFVANFNGQMQVLVGYGYPSQGQIVRPVSREESGARNGPAVGKKNRGTSYALKLVGAQGLQVGTDFARLDTVNLRTGPDYGPLLPLNKVKTGYVVDSLTSDYSFDTMFCWQVAGPYPCTVSLIGLYNSTQDK